MVNAIKLFVPRAGATDINLNYRGHNHPLRLRPDNIDRCVFLDVFVGRRYRAEFISEPKLIIDASAHAGFATCFFAHNFPHACILALEPDAANFSRLVLNTRAHSNVTAMHAALWREDGQVYVGKSDRSWNIQVRAEGLGTRVRAVTIPTLLREANIEMIDVLKMNVEGAEREIFAGPVDWLGRVRLLMIQLHDQYWPGCAQPVYAAAAQVGFEKYQNGDIDVLRFATANMGKR
jgi:FkbM family methyltransferase